MKLEFNGYSHDETDLRDFLNEQMPNVTGNLNKGAVCMFTNTGDEDFVIDKHQKARHISKKVLNRILRYAIFYADFRLSHKESTFRSKISNFYYLFLSAFCRACLANWSAPLF